MEYENNCCQDFRLQFLAVLFLYKADLLVEHFLSDCLCVAAAVKIEDFLWIGPLMDCSLLLLHYKLLL